MSAASGFRPDGEGFVRHWLVCGPGVTRYDGQAAGEDEAREEMIDRAVVEPPEAIALGEPAPAGEAWAFYQPGRNVFMERSAFYPRRSGLDLYAATDLVAPAACHVRCRVWTANTADVWLNGRHVVRYTRSFHHKRPDCTAAGLALRAGRNRVVVRLQEMGARECPYLVGLQLEDAPEALAVALPGDEAVTAELAAADAWFASLRAAGGGRGIEAAGAPPAAVTAHLSGGKAWRSNDRGEAVSWPPGRPGLTWDADGIASARVTGEVRGQRLVRVLEFPSARRMELVGAGDYASRRQACLEHWAAAAGEGSGRHLPAMAGVLSRHVRGIDGGEADAEAVAAALDWIDARPDCADFPLAFILRLFAGGWGGEGIRGRIGKTLLGFRYWSDETGADAMCFGTENHSLLFHTAQMVAGRMLPDARFAAAGRTGAEQARLGRRRVLKWLDSRERQGFWEFLSSTYYPLTMGALSNVVDLSQDAGLAGRASALLDAMFRQLAEHAFDGVTVGPQGRVYRNIVTPESSGAQGMLALASGRAVAARTVWAALLAASRGYSPPDDLDERMARPVRKTHRQAYAEIHLAKSAGTMLSSLALPAGNLPDDVADHALLPGEPGYQQHLWHATVGRACHVFVNHPGASFDFSSARPGFWYGNGRLPRLWQDGSTLAAVYTLPPTHPMQFTHAHWPADAFDETADAGGWHFGRRGPGCVGLWCSRPVRRSTDVLTDRELRADGTPVAWVCHCADADGLAAFADACRDLAPAFDPETHQLTFAGGTSRQA